MKKLIALFAMLLLTVCLYAQAPQKMNYQAVVRNASNSLVANQNVSVRISILQGSATGASVYTETHVVTTNANGLMSLEIGGGNATTGNFGQIDWANGPYFIKSEIDPAGGVNYSVTSTQQLLSVPYALYAGSAANQFSGDYNDLTNRPTIPQVPTNLSAFNNDAGFVTNAQAATLLNNYAQSAGYITAADVPAQVNADWNATSGAAQILNKPTLFRGNYNDLTNRPTIPQVPANVSAFTNDAGYVTAAAIPAQVNADWNATSGTAQILNKPTLFSGDYNDLRNRPTLFSGNYNDLTNRPTIPQVPTNVSSFNNDAGYITNADIPTNISAFTNDAGYVTQVDVQTVANVPTNVSAFNNDAGYITAADVPAQVNADWNATSGAAQILNKPTLFSGDYNDLRNRPTLFSGNYNDLTNTPTLSNVATSGNYQDLNDLPTIPAAANDATLTIQRNGASVGTFTANASTNKSINIDVPTTTSELSNNSGFITSQDIPGTVSSFANDAHYVSNADCSSADLCDMYNKLNTLMSTISDMQDEITSLHGTINAQDSMIDVLNNREAAPQTLSFDCGTSTVTDHEGNVYHTVKIGNQCWTKENIRCTTSPSTNTYIVVDNATENDWSYSGKKAYHINNETSYADNGYGLLYNWMAAVDTFNLEDGETSFSTDPASLLNIVFSGNRRGICPQGWHVPSNDEFTQLTDYMESRSAYQCGGVNTNIAKALASASDWNAISTPCAIGNTPADNDAAGFSAFPTGTFSFMGFDGFSWNANFWTATQNATDVAYALNLSYDSQIVTANAEYKDSGFSVRCLRDNGVSGPASNNESGAGGGDNSCCTELGSRIEALENTIAAQDSLISALNERVDPQFLCGTNTVMDHEGNVYNTIKVGNQCWTKENMRCTTSPSTRTSILVDNAASSDYSYSGKKAYYYGNESANAANGYGLLYNWCAAVDTFNTTYGETSMNTNNGAPNAGFDGPRRGICPKGWHIPSDADWTEMTNAVVAELQSGVTPSPAFGSGTQYEGANTSIASFLAGGNDWNSSSTNDAPGRYVQATRGTSGFEVLPCGQYFGYFEVRGSYAYFWSATQSETKLAYTRSLRYNSAGVNRLTSNKYMGFAVRCLRDNGLATSAMNNEVGDTTYTEDDAMERLRERVENLENEVESLQNIISDQDSVINALNDRLPFECGLSSVKDHEGNVYNTVKIGEQCWTKENMRCVSSPSTGTNILEAPADSATYSGKRAYYVNGNADNSAMYGLLYNWNAVMDTFNVALGETSTSTEENDAVDATFEGNHRGICPEGWHVPNDSEWSVLTNYVSAQSEYQCNEVSANIAKSLADSENWNTYSVTCSIGKDQSSNNATGFSAVPAGYFLSNYGLMGRETCFFSADQDAASVAKFIRLYYQKATVNSVVYEKNYAYSVRCVRD